MRFAKRFLTVAGTVALAGLIGTMLVPKAAQAVVSALVSVVNDVAVVNPTPSGTVQPIVTTDTDSLSRVPYQDGCVTINDNPSQEILVCFGSPLPAGKRLVIEQLTALCNAPTGKVTAGQILTTIGSSFLSHFLVLTPQDTIAGSAGRLYATSELVHLYEDPGSVVEFEFFSGDGAAQCTTSLSGYLEPTNIQ